MIKPSRLLPLVALALVLSLASVAPAFAQARVRVTADQVNVWRPGFAVVAIVAHAGDVLEVVRRQGNWYEVVLPGAEWQRRETGFISVGRVELLDGSADIPTSPPRSVTPSRPGTPQPGRRSPGAQRGARPASPPRQNTLRLFGEGGYEWFAARDAFKAVLGKSRGPTFGGGLRYEGHRRYFIEGSVEHFQSTGERVFVFDDLVYGLGIKDTVSITPVMLTGGLQLPGRRYTTYVGGGAGAYLVRETSDFADATDNVKETKAAYRALAGVQWPVAREVSLGFEVQYTTVPDALTGGAAAALNESNLGGVQVRAKILFGR
jgi:opacity protein-like surface antigen